MAAIVPMVVAAQPLPVVAAQPSDAGAFPAAAYPGVLPLQAQAGISGIVVAASSAAPQQLVLSASPNQAGLATVPGTAQPLGFYDASQSITNDGGNTRSIGVYSCIFHLPSGPWLKT